jgi:hypothetical protein
MSSPVPKILLLAPIALALYPALGFAVTGAASEKLVLSRTFILRG